MVKKCVLAGLALAVALPLGSCRVEQEQIGICTGDQDGELYSLYIVNFMDGLVDAYVDGRRTGRVSNYNYAAHAPGFTNFGTFPQCDDATFTFSGNATIYVNEFEWTPEAMQVFPDGCALEIWLLNDEYENYIPEDWFDFGQKVPLEYAELADKPRCPTPNCYIRFDGELINCFEVYEEASLTPPDIINPEGKAVADLVSFIPHPQIDGVMLMTIHEEKVMSEEGELPEPHQPLDLPPGVQ